MWDITGDYAWHEQREAAELGEVIDWGDYIPVGELVLPAEPADQNRGLARWFASAGRLLRSLLAGKLNRRMDG
jgi:hypothetical protein